MSLELKTIDTLAGLAGSMPRIVSAGAAPRDQPLPKRAVAGVGADWFRCMPMDGARAAPPPPPATVEKVRLPVAWFTPPNGHVSGGRPSQGPAVSSQGMWVAMTWNCSEEPRGAGWLPNCIATLPSSFTSPLANDPKSMPAMMSSWKTTPEACETVIDVPGNTVGLAPPGVVIVRLLMVRPLPVVVVRAQILMALGSPLANRWV